MSKSSRIRNRVRRGRRSLERGASAVEYALMVSLVAIAIIAAVTGLGGKVGASMNKSSGSMAGDAAGAVTETTASGGMTYEQWCASLGSPYHLNGSGVCVQGVNG